MQVLQKTFSSKPISLLISVTPKYVAALMGLHSPRLNENDVAFFDPYPAPDLSGDPADPGIAVGAPDAHPAIPEQLLDFA
jgi:hypothetical protein